jgi:HEPN domain-containing protein
MKPNTQPWVDKAEEDWDVAQSLARKRKRPAFNAVCFFAQQCAEKYLKARLEEAGIPCKRTHDLEVLLKLALPLEPTRNVLLADAQYRYQGASATKADAVQAIKSCRRLRKMIRPSFGLPV